MCAYQDLVQGTIIRGLAVIGALIHSTLNALVLMLVIHGCPSFFHRFRSSMPHFTAVILPKKKK